MQNDVRTVLELVRDFWTEDKYCTRHLAIDEDGNEVPVFSRNARKGYALGVIMKCVDSGGRIFC